MTSRPRQASSRQRMWDDPTRRNMLMNIGFAVAIAAALLTLIVAFAVSWYGDHLAAAVKVNDVTLSMDDVARQTKVNRFLVDYQKKRLRTLLSSGQMWATDANGRISGLDQQSTSLASLSTSQLTDGTILLDLAKQNGQALTADDIAAKEKDTATQPELRHLWMIKVSPTAAGSTSATAAETAAAKAKADEAAQSLKGGGDWATIAKATSTDTATAPQGGDVGFIDSNSSLDSTLVAAVFAAQPNTPTEVITGADGSFYIGKYTDTVASSVDANFASAAQEAGVSQADLDWSFQFAAAKTKVNDWVDGQALAPAPQRHVYRIFMQYSANESGKSAVRVRHILFSPKHDPQAATSLAPSDPAWAAAKTAADAAYTQLKADPTQFDTLARTQNDDTNAAASGGKLGYLADDGGIDAAFAAAVFASGLKPGEILAPVKSQYGWHVVQIMHFPTDAEWAKNLVSQASSLEVFKTLARDNSDDPQSKDGGDMGWVGQHTYQTSDTLAAAIFAAPVGKVSAVTSVDQEGTYIFWVAAEETRAPDAAQAETIKSSAFTTWYTPQRAKYTIWQNPALTGSSAGG